MVGGVGGVAAMEDGTDHAFMRVEGEASPFTELLYFGALNFQVL